MALVEYNPVIESFRGQIGNLIFKKSKGKNHVSLAPGLVNREWDSKAARKPFHIVLAQRDTPTLDVTMTNSFTRQYIEGVDLSLYNGCAGSELVFRGRSDLEAEDISVAISSDNGCLIEKGTAVPSAGVAGRWFFTTRETIPVGTEISVAVTARQKPDTACLSALLRPERQGSRN